MSAATMHKNHSIRFSCVVVDLSVFCYGVRLCDVHTLSWKSTLPYSDFYLNFECKKCQWDPRYWILCSLLLNFFGRHKFIKKTSMSPLEWYYINSYHPDTIQRTWLIRRGAKKMIWKSFALLCVALYSAVASPSAKATTSSLRGVDEKKTKSYRDNATDQNHHHQRSRILEEDVHGTYLLVS